MARMTQKTIYLPVGDLETIEQLAAEAPAAVDRATFFRYSLILGAHVVAQAYREIKPEILGPAVLKALLLTKAGRKLVKVSAVAEEELTE